MEQPEGDHGSKGFRSIWCNWIQKLLATSKSAVPLSVLTSLAMFMLSFFEIPRGVLQKLDYYRYFFWRDEEHKKKYCLAKWTVLCTPKDFGGLGIHNLDLQN